ncbi:MAG: alpha/beta fold hydrolase [Solirubrobacterales bacterium]|nr:alpha/beta fold hydrolase [Solirubrobacterales bacterium]
MSDRIDGIAYEVAGEGPALLLIHAGIADRRMWDPIWERLTGRFTAIRYDQRGFGESDDPTATWWLHEDAAAVLGAAGVDRAIVLGASMGGSVALDLAIDRAELVERLATVGSTPDGFDHDPALLARFEEVDSLVDAGDIDTANELELQIWMDGTRAPGAAEPAARALISETNRALLERQPDLPEPRDLEPPSLFQLGRLTAPLLVAAGEYDQPSTRRGSELIADRTGSRFVEIPGAAHLPSLERPDAFLDAVLPFLGGQIA